tara:strand:- start:67 stop:1035 length:969 start_codon:yes stop_codon:yes gene_type:complete
MKFDSEKLSKVIEQNFSHLMPDFYEMQTEYLASLNIIYDDLDASLVAMVLTNFLYKETLNNKKNNSFSDYSVKNFYKKDKFELPITSFKIKDVSNLLNLPRETVRRKKEKLIKDQIIFLDKKNKIYILNTDKIDKKIIDNHINNLSKFLSKFSVYFSKSKFFIPAVSKEDIKKDIDKKFLIYLVNFLDFQISYFANLKTILDIESIFIGILCNLNTLSSKSKNEKSLNTKDLFYKLHELNTSFGLNATSISEITRIPRTTVLRKISNLEKIGILKKDKYKRYASDNLAKAQSGKKILSAVEHNVSLLGIFFTQCLETYVAKQ